MAPFLIIIYLIVLAAITGFCLVKADISNWIRIALVAVSFFVASAYYFHVDTLRGYATSVAMEEGHVSWIEIVEPTEEDIGGIYIWGYEVTKKRTVIDQVYGINSKFEQPRSFRLPYNKENARKFSTMQQKLRQGYMIKSERLGEESENGSGEQGPQGATVYGFKIIDPRPNVKDQ